MTSENSLQEKWWWRALKVIYIFVWLISIGIAGFWGYSERPQRIPSDWRIDINCVNKTNSFWDSASTNGVNGILTPDEEILYRKECQYGLKVSDYVAYPTVSTRNFTISPYYNSMGNANAAWARFWVGLVISLVVIETIKSIFLYIMGIRVWRGLLTPWFLKFGTPFVIGAIIYVLLGSTRSWIAWVIFMIVAFGYEFLKKYRKKRINKP